MSRSVRFVAALAAIFAIAFAQLALAAHGCARIAQHSPDCAKMAMPNGDAPSSLCLKHCEDGKASVDVAKPLAPVAVASIVSIPLPALVPIASAQRTVSPASPYPPPPSFAARSAALRI